MEASNQAAEQLVRMTLSGSEVALKLTGAGAKNVAAALMAAASSAEKTKGKTTLATMLRSGKELKVFQIPEKDLKAFAQEAKRYGVLYVVVRENGTDGKGSKPVDLMVKAEDASKINRIIDKLDLSRVDANEVASVVADIEREKAKEPEAADIGVELKDANTRAVEEALGMSPNALEKEPDDPLVNAPQPSPRSETTSGKKSRSDGATTDKTPDGRERRSVKRDIEQKRDERKASEAQKDSAKTTQPQIQHQQPVSKRHRDKTLKGR